MKTKEELEFIISKENKPQVLILGSKLPFPLNFAIHVYFLTLEKNKIDRFEVMQFKKKNSFIWFNELKPFQGFNIFPFNKLKIKFKKFKLIKHITGDDAIHLIKILKKESPRYIYKNKYKMFPGPNSNTYAQFIINNSPELKINLPWNAFGKNYKN